ncbi:hypothetical protein JCM9534A_27250 [Catenuloplanes indicus JCM 9534]
MRLVSASKYAPAVRVAPSSSLSVMAESACASVMSVGAAWALVGAMRAPTRMAGAAMIVAERRIEELVDLTWSSEGVDRQRTFHSNQES